MKLGFVGIKGDSVILEVVGGKLFFNTFSNGLIQRSDIDGLKLNPAGIVKEFPDLEGKPIPEMKREAINRFKEKFKKIKNKKDQISYLKEELLKVGYELKMIQEPGHRDRRVKNGNVASSNR